MVKPIEQAILIIKGREYKDWESVAVRHAVLESPPYKFRFTCSEFSPIGRNFAVLQIRPGDDCTIILAGQLAFSGRVRTRQVFYDAHRHHIEIQGATYAHEAASKTAVTKTGEIKNVDFNQLARKLLTPIGVNYKTIGLPIKNFKFPRVSIAPGQYIYDVLEQHARQLGVLFTSNEHGDFVASGGAPEGQGGDAVIEGINILEGREIIQNDGYMNSYPTGGQSPGTDKKNGPQVSHVPFAVSKNISSVVASLGLSYVISEIPAWDTSQLENRSATETNATDVDSVFVTITVHGWLKPSGGLWGPPLVQKVFVDSPMLIMKETLTLRAVTFTQDNQTGTRSTLELVNQRALGGVSGPLGTQRRDWEGGETRP